MYPATPAGRAGRADPLACRKRSWRWSRYDAQLGHLSSSRATRWPWTRLELMAFKMDTTRALPDGVRWAWLDSSSSFNSWGTRSQLTDCWTNSSVPLGELRSRSRYSRPVWTCSGWLRMATATGWMHSSRDRASTQVQLLEMGFRRFSSPQTADGLLHWLSRRSIRGSGPSAGMCSSSTGWLCSRPQMDDTISFVLSGSWLKKIIFNWILII